MANEVPVVPLASIMLAVGLSRMGFSPVATALGAVMRGKPCQGIVPAADDLTPLAESCINPVLGALAAEACWQLRIGAKPYRFAVAAVQAYRDLASRPEWLLSDQAEFLDRALALAVELNDGVVARQVALALMAVLRGAVAGAPGRDSRAFERLDMQLVRVDGPEAHEALAERQFHDASWFALRSFARHRRAAIFEDATWEEIERCAAAAFDEASSDRSLRRALFEPVAALTHDTVARRSIVELHLRAEVAWARTQVLGTRYVTLVQAERTAREDGLPAFAGELQREIQGIDRAALLSPIRTGGLIDKATADAAVENFLEQVFVGDDWRMWVRNLVVVAGCPLMPDLARELKDVYVAARPLGSSLPALTAGPNSVPLRADSGGRPLGDHAVQAHVQFFSCMFLVPALSEMLRRIALVDAEDLMAFFVSKGLDRVRAGHVLASLRLYGAGDVDGATHKVLPRIEHLLRARASAHASVIRPTDGTTRGGVDQLGGVLAALDGHIDETWRRYLQFVLVDDGGLNLRNDTLHGLRPEVNERDAAIVLHALLVVCFLDDLASEGVSGIIPSSPPSRST